ncbi:hypothetical protein VTN96DRAFT_3866 [Rasamsonia emersonii]|uniref:Cell wall proline rich protein n=1 Tax=Rasamsonia emersonii (strain ATCC 16479 / CBS 393.64 / IMI 116815) TaxID=1408163 RepID=A0A0F4YXF6_RASE3|nr:Cell wall proline rich protein [Rasamsonia emersonii CBS 393.64]KKA22531.1 Cell wall proline rich protein [Rasamsonia emersonii CBS 393.64]
MASISIPPQTQVSAHPPALGSVGCESEQDASNVTVSGRPPNPPFVFPARDTNSSDNKRDEPVPHVPPPLPAFSFNPGNIHAPSPSTSTLSVNRPPGQGHRRRPSELIGGEGPPSPSMLSTSPANPETSTSDSSNLPPPGAGRSAPGPGRRGHAHRRSGAISSMDLTTLAKAFPAGGSAPCTPAGKSPDHGFHDDISKPMSKSATSLHRPSPPASPANKSTDYLHPGSQGLAPPSPGPATPRPVSTVSIETSSSLATVRPGHSRSNSAAPSTRVETSPSAPKVRPKTADASMLLSPSGNNLSPGDLQLPRPVEERPEASESHPAPSSDDQETKEDKKKKKKKKKKKRKQKQKKHLGDSGGSEESPGKSPSGNEAVDTTREPGGDTCESASSIHSRSGAENAPSSTGKSHKSDKKQKKMRSWADAIFPLKSKRPHVKVPRRSPTPPPIITRTNSDIGSMDGVNFDDDNIVIIRTPTNPNAPKPPQPRLDTTFENSWKPRSFYEQNLDNDSFSPVIDLDAALGPFNTPEMSSSRVAGSAFSIASRRMYSGGRRGEFIGPEMRYHRRAESAPEMPPFDRSALGFHRFGSSSTMAHADVFYEEEEDAFLAENQSCNADGQSARRDSAASSSAASSSAEADGAQPSSSDTLETVVQGTAADRDPPDDGLGIQVEAPGESSSDAAVEDGPGDAVVHDEPGEAEVASSSLKSKKSVEIVESDDWPSQAPNAPSSDASSHIMSLEKRPCSSPVDFSSYAVPQLPLPGHTHSSSAFPSPDPSNISFEAPRSATASSMTDQTSFPPFHDQTRGSIEDVPSLTSSVSTRTNNRPRFSSGFHARSSGERSASFSTRPRSSHSHTAKRTSLVSLSRLVGASHGEKSKLSYEEKPPADEHEKTKKKGHRISRLMHFWKTKEKQKSKGEGD